MSTVRAKISYKKSYVSDSQNNTILLIKYKNNLYVEKRMVNKPTIKEIFEQPFIPRIYRLNKDNSISVGKLITVNNVYVFKQSPYYD